MKIYKYTSIDSAIQIINTSSVLLRSPSQFNDPFDSALNIAKRNQKKAFDLTENYIIYDKLFSYANDPRHQMRNYQRQQLMREYLLLRSQVQKTHLFQQIPIANELVNSVLGKDSVKKHFVSDAYDKFCDEIVGELKAIWSKSLVSCFSTRSDSVLMWSHYGNSHRGVCIEFERPNFTDFYDVKYSDRKAALDLFKTLELILGYLFLQEKPNSCDQELAKIILNVFCTKSKDWSYEKEVRCIFSSENDRDKIAFEGSNYFCPMSTPTRVFLGCRSTEHDFASLHKILVSKGIPFSRVRESKTEYRLVVDDNG